MCVYIHAYIYIYTHIHIGQFYITAFHTPQLRTGLKQDICALKEIQRFGKPTQVTVP
jgi:hypothetical protein